MRVRDLPEDPAPSPGVFERLNRREFGGAQSAACGSPRCRAYRPQRSCGRVAEGGGLLNRYRVVKPYRGFESLRLRQFITILIPRDCVALCGAEASIVLPARLRAQRQVCQRSLSLRGTRPFQSGSGNFSSKKCSGGGEAERTATPREVELSSASSSSSRVSSSSSGGDTAGHCFTGPR